MQDQTTLFEVLAGGTERLLVYDIGRRICQLSSDVFVAFERAQQPYPQPMQRKAWFALVQQSADRAQDPIIWFLHLALDEQGLIVQAERDYLLNRLIESAHARQSGADAQAFLRDNPHAFTPRDDRMALFHALLSRDLGLPPSRFYAHALAYFRGELGWDQWGFVGYQGIADIACRHHDAPVSEAVAKLPREPLIAACHCLESNELSGPLCGAVIARLTRALAATETDIGEVTALLRALGGNAQQTVAIQALHATIEHAIGKNIEVLAAIGGRVWPALNDTALLGAYLLALACNDHGQAAFEQCLSDLLSLPSLAPTIRGLLRDPSQPDRVRDAFGLMTQNTVGR